MRASLQAPERGPQTAVGDGPGQKQGRWLPWPCPEMGWHLLAEAPPGLGQRGWVRGEEVGPPGPLSPKDNKGGWEPPEFVLTCCGGHVLWV